MYSVLESLFSMENMVMLLTAVAAFATVLTLAGPMLTTDKLSTRMKSVSTEREALRRAHREQMEREKEGRQLRQAPKDFIKQFVDKLNLIELMEGEAVRGKLKMAGFRGQAPVYSFMFFRFVMPFILFAVALVYLSFVNNFGLQPMARLAASMGAAFAGFYAPNVFVQNMITRRQESIKKAFPDSLDLLLICVESGMSAEAAFNKVATEIGTQSVELAEELSLTVAELSYLQDRRQAYENLAIRTGLEGVKAVVMSLIQAERYGTPLGSALRVMAQENRDMRMAAAEKKAAGLPPKLTVPMIMFFLPVLFAVILGPAIIRFVQG
ncbi:MAG: type II secretion system F family protein [Alphaproteobacteria bacterium]|nr:type II secretion system F family protein [Alphaproteobacteria bacterium]MBO6627599.1 type II secretion system F family protein [Alphaproteobacteria bacterium]MDF1627783.1 type II secretion system F family protein [Parvibaculaceae bacterium]